MHGDVAYPVSWRGCRRFILTYRWIEMAWAGMVKNQVPRAPPWDAAGET